MQEGAIRRFIERHHVLSSYAVAGSLTLVRRLVELHGGTVSARSDRPGRGAVFVVDLPGVDVSTAPAELDRPRAGRARSPERV